MRLISPYDWPGTTTELRARVAAFRAARIAHAQTVGVPAPREEELIEKLVDLDDDQYAVDAPPAPEELPPPTKEELDALARRISFEEQVGADAQINALKEMSNAQYNAWFDANITTASAAIALLKRLLRVLILKVL